MNKRIYRLIVFIVTVLVYTTATAQISIESFTKDETDQDARIVSLRKDQNDKVCAIVKIETPLLLSDFTFDAGMTAVTYSEQKNREIWLWLSPGTLRLTITHKHLGIIRNYPFGDALKEATVYIMKLKSGSVKTVVEEIVSLQYIEIRCEIENATVKIDEADPEAFTNGKFQKLLSYGKHKYTVEAPMYHPESGITEITAQKSAPITIALKPKFGKLVINTQPEQNADVFIDDEKRGKSPLTIEKLGSGQHKIRAVKPQFLSATKEITMTDGASETLTLNLPPNFAVITLTTPDGGDIYINDKKEGSTQWSGRLTPGQYKVEVLKLSHRPSVKAIEVAAGIDKTISLEAPTPIYGSLNVTSGNVNAAVFIDGKKIEETTPAIINKILIGEHEIKFQADGHVPYTQTVDIPEGKIFELNAILQDKGSLRITANITAKIYMDGKEAGNTPFTANNLSSGTYKIELQANGYKPYAQTVNVQDGKISELNATLQEEDKTGSLRITTNIPARVKVDGKYIGYTPITTNLLLGKKRVSFKSSTYKGYRLLTKTVTITPGNNELYGRLKEKKSFSPVWLFEYRYSTPLTFFGFSFGYCKKWGGYMHNRTMLFDLLADEFEWTITAGGMLQVTKFMFVSGGAGYRFGIWGGAPELECGITFKMRRFAMTVGYNYTLPPGSSSDYRKRDYYFHFGIGGFKR
jgi:hypothetical protein